MRKIAALSIMAVVSATQLNTKTLEVSQNYDGPEGKAELMGVCKVTESDITCWGPDRKPNKPLVEDVKRALTQNDYSSTAWTRYGKKNRLIVYRFTLPSRSDRGVGQLSDNFQNGGNNLDLQRNSSSEAGEPRVTVKGTYVSANSDQKTASITLNISRTAEASDPLPLKEGASIQYLGATYKIVKIVKSQLDPAVYGAPGAGRWLVYTGFEGEARGAVAWTPYNSDGLRITAVDEAGKSVYVDPAILQNIRNQLEGFRGQQNVTPLPKVFPANFGAGYSGGYYYGAPSDVIATNIDPAEVKHLTLQGSGTQNVKIGDIPLDPK